MTQKLRLTGKLLIIGLAFRLIAARTNLGLGHPDEWFQTVEFANLLGLGFGSHTQETAFHFRNLSWPWLLSWPIRLAEWLSPGGVALKTYLIKATTGLLDLAGILCWVSFWRQQKGFSERALILLLALWIFPWFWIGESVRPSQEHLSAIAFAATIAAWAQADARNSRGLALWGGVAAVMTGAMRPASGLLGAGALVAYLWNRRSHQRGFALLGALVGCVAGGLADWVYYGRPWESLWMYFQYNVATGLSSAQFGAQPWTVYLDYFRGVFVGPLLPIGVLALLLAPWGLVHGLRKQEPWALGTTAFIAGHLWVGHKEPRFMAPILGAVLWSTALGLAKARAHFKARPVGHTRNALVGAAALLLLWNAALVIKSLWGDTWKTQSNFLAVDSLLKSSRVCGIISLKRPLTSQLPWNGSPALGAAAPRVPDPAVAFLPLGRGESLLGTAKQKPLLWVMRAPECTESQTLLVQPRQIEGELESQHGCKLLRTGPLAWLSDSQGQSWIRRGWVSSPWYECPSQLLSLFPIQPVHRTVQFGFTRLPSLPRPGITGPEYKAWAEARTQSPESRYDDSTFGQW